jgi:hypothetical protein
VSTGMEPGGHPLGDHLLEVDLADLVDGLLEGNALLSAQQHLDTCPTCRAAFDVEFTELALPSAIAEVPPSEPAAGEIWRLEWEGVTSTVVVRSVDELLSVVPVRFVPMIDLERANYDRPLLVGADAWRPIGGSTWAVPLGVFRDRLEASLEERGPNMVEAVPSWDAALSLASTVSESAVLAAASWLPDQSDSAEPFNLLAELEARGATTADVVASTSLRPGDVVRIARSDIAPTDAQAAEIAAFLGVPEAAVGGRVSVPAQLARAIERPAHRLSIKARALQKGITEAVERLTVTQGVQVLSARTSPGGRTVDTWSELVTRFLDEESA